MKLKPNARHVLGLSGGKDSAALAIYLKRKGTVSNIEYFFCDTGHELPEVYEFLERLEAYLEQPIVRLQGETDGGKTPFEHALAKYNNFLPSPKQRWCTRELKLRPFERFVGEDEVYTYIGIRADENRDGYLSTKANITPLFPFMYDGVTREEVFQILRETVGIPAYYEWRSRSGCYFCFFQKKQEWIGLLKKHPKLFEDASRYEKVADGETSAFTWTGRGSLSDLAKQASQLTELPTTARSEKQVPLDWRQALALADDEDDEKACTICAL